MKACGITDVGLQRHENQDTFAAVSYTHLTLPTIA